MGWLDRSPYRFGTPFSQDLGPIDPRTGLPVAQPTQQNPYAPPAAPRAPTAQQRTQQPNFGQPYQMGAQPMMPVPDFQMGYIDPSMAAYANQGGGLFDLASSNPADVSMKAYQPQPGDQATGSGQDKSQYALNGMLGNINNQDLLSLGLSLLGNSQNGGDWGQVGRDLQGIQQGAMSREDRAREIERQKVADQREAKKFDVWDLEQQDAASKRARWEAARKAADPETQVLLDQLGPEGYGQFLLQQKQQESAAALAKLEAEQRKTLAELQIRAQASEGAKDRQAQLDAANLRLNGTLDSSIAQAMALAGVDELAKAAPALQVAQSTVGDLNRMKTLVGELQQLSGMNNVIDLPLRKMIEMAKGKGGEAVKAKIEEFEKLQADLVTQKAQLMKPVSNADFQYFQKILANPNMTVEGALNIINGMKEGINWDVETNAFNTKWLKDYKGGPGTLNEKGQTREQARGQRPEFDPAKYLPASSGIEASGGGEIPNNAVTLLKQDPSPAKKRQFDEIFGAGAADRVLSNRPYSTPDASYSFGGY